MPTLSSRYGRLPTSGAGSPNLLWRKGELAGQRLGADRRLRPESRTADAKGAISGVGNPPFQGDANIPREDDAQEQLDLFDPNPRAVRAPDHDDPRHPLHLSRPLPYGLYLGTSSWGFPGWEGLLYEGVYPEPRLAERGLEAYARCPLFRTVSLDKSYYRPPSQAEFARLAAQVPDDFRFVVKAPRDLLEPRAQGFDSRGLIDQFLHPASRGLGEKLGVVLLQFPPGAGRGGRVFTRQLGDLLRLLPTSIAYSLEVRDAELLGPPLREAIEGSPTSLCASIHPRLPAPEKQLLAVPPNPGTPLVFRWNLRPSLDYEKARDDFAPFNQLRSPDPDRRERVAHMIARALKAGRMVYATANNKAEGCAPLSLRALLDAILVRLDALP